MMTMGGKLSWETHSERRKGILVTAIKWLKIAAPATINMTMHVMRSVSLPAFTKPDQVSFRLSRPSMRTPAAPAPPA